VREECETKWTESDLVQVRQWSDGSIFWDTL
jgi:hypothetical protein